MGLESPRVWKVSKELTIVYWEDGAASAIFKDRVTLLGKDGVRYDNPCEQYKQAVKQVLEKSNE